MVEYSWGHLMGFQATNYVFHLWTKDYTLTWFEGSKLSHSRRQPAFEGTCEKRTGPVDCMSYHCSFYMPDYLSSYPGC